MPTNQEEDIVKQCKQFSFGIVSKISTTQVPIKVNEDDKQKTTDNNFREKETTTKNNSEPSTKISF